MRLPEPLWLVCVDIYKNFKGSDTSVYATRKDPKCFVPRYVTRHSAGERKSKRNEWRQYAQDQGLGETNEEYSIRTSAPGDWVLRVNSSTRYSESTKDC